MSSQPTYDFWFIGSLFVTGGVLATLLTLFGDWLLKGREESNAISTVRIQTLAKAMPYYNQLAMNSWNFGWSVIEQSSEDHRLSMYYICNMLYFREQITKRFGDIQLSSLKAEEILSNFWRDIKLLIVNKFGYADVSKLTNLVANELPYHEFLDKISNENKELYDLFVNWLSVEFSESDSNTFEKCMWYSQLLMLESNHIYKSWYDEEPPLILREDLKDYLNKHERKYYDRICSFHLKTNLQKR